MLLQAVLLLLLVALIAFLFGRARALVLLGTLLVLALTALAWLLAPLPGVKILGPLGLSLLLGVGVRAAVGLPAGAAPGVRFFARPLLRVAIVLMGVRLDFNKLAEAGPRVLVVDTLVVFLGAALVAWLGGRMGVRRSLALLLGTGTSVCGASAIAAAGPLVRADEDDVAVSIGLVSLLGTIGVVAYPALGRLFGLADNAYAILCGATLHEVPQVLAAAFARGVAAGDLGTLVKLTRVALLAPLALGLAALEARHRGEKISLEHLPIPWFVVLFVVVGALRSFGVVPLSWVPWLEQASKLLLVAAMAAVGLGVHIDAVRRLGWAPIALAGMGWLFVITTAALSAGALGLLR